MKNNEDMFFSFLRFEVFSFLQSFKQWQFTPNEESHNDHKRKLLDHNMKNSSKIQHMFTGIFCQRILFLLFYYLISLICQNPAFCKILPKLSPKKVTTRLYNTTPLRKIRKVWLDRDRHGNLFTPSCFRPFPFGLGEVLTKKWPGH